MIKRKASAVRRAASGAMRGRQYPGIQGKVVDFADHAFEDGALYVRVRFMDSTEICWRIASSMLIEEADLGDWKTGNFQQLRVFCSEGRAPGITARNSSGPSSRRDHSR